jgi:hypothetical protein
MKNTANEKVVLCPSADCKENAILLGLVQKNGHIHFVSDTKIFVDNEFVHIANRGRKPEKRFRFADKCMTSGCKQWTENRCCVIDKVMSVLTPIDEPSELPACSIRDQCRWYEQCGGKACMVCSEVITDME